MVNEESNLPGGLVLLSYGWLTAEHPDPQGFYTRSVQQYLKAHQAYYINDVQTDFGVFWDFASLPQSTGIQVQEMCAVAQLYGSPWTTVVQLKQIPDGTTPYHKRGWCEFQESISSIIKPCTKLLNLEFVNSSLDAGVYALDDGMDWHTLSHDAQAEMRPPIFPDDFQEGLPLKEFHDEGDSILVTNVYRWYFNAVAQKTQRLVLCNRNYPSSSGWGKHEAAILAHALSAFSNCEELNLAKHMLGDDGIALLAAAIPKLRKLRELSFEGCDFGIPGLQHLSEMLHSLPTLKLLNLPEHLRGTDEGKSLQCWWEERAGDSGRASDDDGKSTLQWL